MLPELIEAIAEHSSKRPGVRLHGHVPIAQLLSQDRPIGAIAASILGNGSQPVRTILFDKRTSANWALGWHQDRTIAVKGKVELPGYGPWTVKDSMHHVAPPYDLLDRMLTLRVHIDPVTDDNAPLLVALGSHRLGRIEERRIAKVVTDSIILACVAEPGDLWAYATPVLHASDAARIASGRRVLQVDFCAEDLPGDLEWLGI